MSGFATFLGMEHTVTLICCHCEAVAVTMALLYFKNNFHYRFHILERECSYGVWFCYILGVEHTVTLICCQCEAVAVTMARARLWPATAQNPQLAFTFELLDWAEALLYECQVSVKDFLAALKYKCRHIVIKVDICMVRK